MAKSIPRNFSACLFSAVGQSNSRLASGRFPCSQSLISASILRIIRWSFIFTGCIFFQEPVLQTDIPIYHICFRISENVFLIYNIHSRFPEKFKAPSRFNCTFASTRESIFSAMDILFLYPAGVFFSIFFLPDNNGSYLQASGYRENDCNRIWVIFLYLDRSLFLLPGLSFSP